MPTLHFHTGGTRRTAVQAARNDWANRQNADRVTTDGPAEIRVSHCPAGRLWSIAHVDGLYRRRFAAHFGGIRSQQQSHPPRFSVSRAYARPGSSRPVRIGKPDDRVLAHGTKPSVTGSAPGSAFIYSS